MKRVNNYASSFYLIIVVLIHVFLLDDAAKKRGLEKMRKERLYLLFRGNPEQDLGLFSGNA